MDAMELAAAARHGCKVCGKSFLCGRSLGGHMRSHISLGEVAAPPDVHADDEPRRASPNGGGGRSCNGVVGYGLRENPRKTRRLSDFASEEDGGHGVGDGDGDGEHKACRECGKLFSSWRSLFGHMRSHASGGRYRDVDEDDVDVGEEEFVPVPEEAEQEAEEAEMATPTEAPVAAAPAALAVLSTPPRRRRRSMRVAAPPPAPPPVTSGFEKEPEDVALCLLMLSRDTGKWSSPTKQEPSESVEKQAGFPKNGGYGYNSDDEESALLQHGDAKIKGRVAKSRKRRRERDPVAVAPKRTRYDCPGCGKAFSSYQALGGHRASHKRINASCSSPKATTTPAAAAPEPSTETYASFNTLSPSASPDSVAIGAFGKSKDDAKFECAVCFRAFASAQALGWHKRSHQMPDSEFDDVELCYVGGAGADHQEQHSAAASDGFLDLNFPPAAPGEEA